MLKVERLCRELETMTLNEIQARFERIYPYLKRKEGNLRLIARIRSLESDRVLCWLKVFRRGDNEYLEFLRTRENFANGSLEVEVDTLLPQWLKQQKASNNLTPNQLPQLPPHLQIWLKRPDWQMYSDGSIIYESETWISRFSQEYICSQWQEYYHLLSNIVSTNGSIGENTVWSQIKLYGSGKQFILYSILDTADNPSQEVFLLIAPFAHFPSDREITEVVNASLIKDNALDWWRNQCYLTLDALTRFARRAYPSYLLADEQIWLAIERGNGVNLALSAEEKALLNNVSTQQSLPLFLNGRAGSGKSTILFYLFADYCDRHLRYCQQQEQDFLAKPHPLFLSFNQAVTELAKKKVIALLTSNYRFLAQQEEYRAIPDLSPFFHSWRSFLRQLLPPQEREYFTEDKYISFHRFRQLSLHTWRGFSPEKCWLVIRTFIKGYHLDDRDTYNCLEDYQEIPKKERIVSLEEFQGIYQQVWKWYEKYTKEHHLWDDQDLIRKILQFKYYQPQYTAIFCDEAQDFTRLELQLIMRLSVFSRYDLEHIFRESLPFAFAGDPLQTLNPTGFRWASLQAAFYDEVLTVLTPTSKSSLKMNFAELKYNYRSVPAIVGLSNLIQLWRKLLFQYQEIQPQKALKSGQFIPEKYILGHNIDSDTVKRILQDRLVIIPCDEGGERDFINQDEILSCLVNSQNYPENPWNIFSAIAAKGLEFKQVILYKFGNFYSTHIWQKKAESTEAEKYFFNKLYVATSRATERLFIIDTILGEEKLWHKATDFSSVESYLELIETVAERQEWQQEIELIKLGESPESIAEDDLESIAQALITEGLNTENPELLRRAQIAYQRLNNLDQATICSAYALKFEQRFLEAGKQFLHLRKLREAWQCFWQEMNWKELFYLSLEYQKELGDNNDCQELSQFSGLFDLVAFMANLTFKEKNKDNKSQKPDLYYLTRFTEKLLTKFNQENLQKYYCSKQWKLAIYCYHQEVNTLIHNQDSISEQEWLKIGAAIDRNYVADNRKFKATIAQCFYLGKNYLEAIKYWEQLLLANSTYIPPQQYYLAKAKIVGIPQGLKYLAKGNYHKTIIQQWLKKGKLKERAWLEYVAPAWEAIKEYRYALIIYCWLDNPTKVTATLAKISQNHLTAKIVARVIKYYLDNQYWSEAIATVQRYLPSVKEKNLLKYYFVYQLAHSHLTPEAIDKSERQQYQYFMRSQILCNSNWQKYLLMQQLGIALEKISFLADTLNFYEKYINLPELSQFARDRWLVSKQKQINYYESSLQIEKAKTNRQQLQSQAFNWNIALDSLYLSPPSPYQKHFPITFVSFNITGLPDNIQLQNLAYAVKQFQLEQLIVKIMPSVQQVLLIDVLTEEMIRLDSRSRQLQINSTTIIANGNDSISFKETKANYSGTLSWNDYSQIDLNLLGVKIKIQFFIQ
jgi:hypothetical protein